MTAHPETTKGLWATTSAFCLWGVVPVYWKAVGAIPPDEIILYRILWALPVLALLLRWRRAFGQVGAALRQRRVLAGLMLSAALVGFNWYVFISAVNDGRVMQTSLGYYINPLVNVLLGFVLLGERMRRMQALAIGLAAAGVAVLVVRFGEVPWVALALAFSFGLYGLVRKLLAVAALPGLFVEVLLLAPLALVWMGLRLAGPGLAAAPASTWALVPLAGLITALPLAWFAYGARRLPLATVGMLQFIAPSGQFLLATLAYGEPFTTAHAVTFACIWSGVALYLLDLLRRARRAARPLPA